MGEHKVPDCPRCGYDLSGEVARWERRCPVAGVCSECGLEFAWADVVSDRLRPPAWSFEHARGAWGWRVARGWRVAINSRRCWNELRLEHRIHPRRLWLSLLLISAAVWIVLGVSSSLVQAAGSMSWAWRGSRFAAGSAGWEVFEIAWREHRRELFLPIVSFEGPPLEIWRGPLVGAWMAALVVTMLAMPLAFLLLPETFRRTRVRRAHLLRAAAYTSVGPALMVLLGVLAIALRWEYELFSLAWVLTAAGCAWLVGAWRRVTRDYLRLPQDRAVWLATSTIALLCGAIAGALLLPGELGAYMWIWGY